MSPQACGYCPCRSKLIWQDRYPGDSCWAHSPGNGATPRADLASGVPLRLCAGAIAAARTALRSPPVVPPCEPLPVPYGGSGRPLQAVPEALPALALRPKRSNLSHIGYGSSPAHPRVDRAWRLQQREVPVQHFKSGVGGLLPQLGIELEPRSRCLRRYAAAVPEPEILPSGRSIAGRVAAGRRRGDNCSVSGRSERAAATARLRQVGRRDPRVASNYLRRMCETGHQ